MGNSSVFRRDKEADKQSGTFAMGRPAFAVYRSSSKISAKRDVVNCLLCNLA